MFTERFFDFNGKEFKVGTRAFVLDIDDETKKHYGVVKELVPQEGDIDDEGRSIAYGPYVIVDFDGEDERFQGHFLEDHYKDYEPGDEYPEVVGVDWEFDEVEVAP